MGERSRRPRVSSLLRDLLRGENERRLPERSGLRERPLRGDRDLSLCIFQLVPADIIADDPLCNEKQQFDQECIQQACEFQQNI